MTCTKRLPMSGPALEGFRINASAYVWLAPPTLEIEGMTYTPRFRRYAIRDRGYLSLKLLKDTRRSI
jgi:hypothetical protein